MGATAEPIITGHQAHTRFTDAQKAAILRELRNILNSRPFRNSARSKQFLSYVVEHKLEGRDEFLKERTIGTEIFQRKAGYATGDDPVVRVQAGEVRRRLEQYHHSRASASPVRIELPLGSYSPEFHWGVVASPLEEKPATAPRKRWLVWTIGAIGLASVLAVVLAIRTPSAHRPSESALDKFWAPIFTTSQPILICQQYVDRTLLKKRQGLLAAMYRAYDLQTHLKAKNAAESCTHHGVVVYNEKSDRGA